MPKNVGYPPNRRASKAEAKHAAIPEHLKHKQAKPINETVRKLHPAVRTNPSAPRKVSSV